MKKTNMSKFIHNQYVWSTMTTDQHIVTVQERINWTLNYICVTFWGIVCSLFSNRDVMFDVVKSFLDPSLTGVIHVEPQADFCSRSPLSHGFIFIGVPMTNYAHLNLRDRLF